MSEMKRAAARVASVYEGNLGFVEMMKFRDLATSRQNQLMDQLISQDQFEEAWKLLSEVTGTALRGLTGTKLAEGEGADQALCQLLSQLRALQQSYWTAHWTATGTAYYGDHLMFERMYESMTPEVDGLAEKIVASYGGNAVDVAQQLQWVASWARQWDSRDQDVFERMLWAEQGLQTSLKGILDVCKDVSIGLVNFLEDLADKHETHIYLLGQRLTGDRNSRDASLGSGESNPSRRVAAAFLSRASSDRHEYR
jgi:DNA-binding ferritin-like protein